MSFLLGFSFLALNLESTWIWFVGKVSRRILGQKFLKLSRSRDFDIEFGHHMSLIWKRKSCGCWSMAQNQWITIFPFGCSKSEHHWSFHHHRGQTDHFVLLSNIDEAINKTITKRISIYYSTINSKEIISIFFSFNKISLSLKCVNRNYEQHHALCNKFIEIWNFLLFYYYFCFLFIAKSLSFRKLFIPML